MSLRQAIILAGGQGTRLRERLGDLPKPLIDVGGVPLLEHQIMLLKRYGYQNIIILVNYKAEQIEQFCKAHDNWGLDIACVDDGMPRGTAGAVLNIFDRLNEEFLVVYGDTMLEVDLMRFEAAHVGRKDNAGTIFLHPNDHPQDSDLVDLDTDGCVSAFYPYPHSLDSYLPNLVNAALYILRREALKPWLEREQTDIFDFGKNLFPQLVASGAKLYGYIGFEYIKDCGTPSRLDKITRDLLSGKLQRLSLAHKQPAVLIDRDGTLNKEVDHLKYADQFDLFDGIEEAVRRLNQSDYRTCVVTNQPVVARGECSLAELKNIHNKLETLLGRKGAFIDRIYVCPHHPDKGFAAEIEELKIHCDCRKPGLGLIEQAERELNVHRAESWLIGDTTTDMETAYRAGLRSILVETGYAGLDHRYPRTPDFTVPDFPAAVKFILDIFPQAFKKSQVLLEHVKQGHVVLIGGHARSGKSTMASVFKLALQAQGLRAHVISTDQWLYSEQERKPGVLGRHDLSKLQQDFEFFMKERDSKLMMHLPVYQRKTRTSVPNAMTLELLPTDIIILEGVIALSLARLGEDRLHPFAVHIDEQERYARFVREYRRRLGDTQQIEILYQQRLKDEYEIVQALLVQGRPVASFTCQFEVQALKDEL